MNPSHIGRMNRLREVITVPPVGDFDLGLRGPDPLENAC
jgi:hypothetical protein